MLLHMLWETWKMKAWISRGTGYYTVFPSWGPAIFWFSLKKIVKVTLWARTWLRKRAWTRREEGRAQLLKEWHIPREYHKLIKIKWVQNDKSNSTKPWSPICMLTDTPRGASRTVPRHCQKTEEEWVVPQLLEWSFHSLAYEITQLEKTNHTTFRGHCTFLCDGPHPVECASLWVWKNPPLPGSSPGGSRVIQRWGRNRRTRKNLHYRYIERLETDSVVGKLVEKKRLNNLVYME